MKQKSFNWFELRFPLDDNYVPVPYPETKEDVKKCLMHYMAKSYGSNVTRSFGRHGKIAPVIRRMRKTDKVFKDFATGKTEDLRIGKIHKIKHSCVVRSRDYFWLIEIVDREGNIAGSVTLDASGVWCGTSEAGAHPYRKLKKSRIRKAVKKVLAQKGIKVEIESITMLLVPYRNGGRLTNDTEFNTFLRVVKLKNRKVYYACSGMTNSKNLRQYMALYNVYKKQLVPDVKSGREFYKHVQPLRSASDVRIDNKLKGEILYLEKLGEMFKYNSLAKDKTFTFHRNIK